MSTGKQDQRVQLVTTRELLTRIDNWRRKQDDLPSRSEAIRRMIDRVLREDGEL
jgi:metal-responsive CopG/Arc/MetJ family transcriptional regulator